MVIQTLSVLFLCFILASAAPAQEGGEIVGIPWTGERGITESVAEIMAREAASPPSAEIQIGRKPKRIRPDRNNLPMNPQSEDIPFWPPLKPGEVFAPPLESPQTLGVNFTAATLGGVNPTFSFPPDDMGDVGPTQYIVAVNGRIVSFNKTTGLADGALNTTMDGFFNSVRGGITTSDPRIRYDRHSGRWFVIIINVASSNNRVLLAVSNSGTITSASNFTFFFFQHNTPSPAGNDGQFGDYPTLGIDPHALYIGLNMFTLPSFSNVTAFVVRKSSMISGGPIVVTAFRNLLVGSIGPYTPQGVDNLDASATDGYFIGVDNATFGTLMMRRVSNPGGSPTMSGNISITVPSTSYPLDINHLGNTGGSNGRLDAIDDRLYQAVVRNGRLWTVHNIGVTNTGSTTSPTRTAARWYELQNLGGTPTVVQSGTLFDGTAPNDQNQRNYWNPSVMVSGQGHVALGFSVAGSNERVNAGTVGRLAGDTPGSLQTPVLYTASTTAYNPPDDPGGPGGRRWGDYSYTSIDPNDDMTMWTVQQFCDATNSYGVRVVQLIAPPPATPVSASPPSVMLGQSSVNVTITGDVISGSGFFDPGPGFPNSIAASVTGGVIVNSITYVNPTTVVLDLNTTGATAGAKNVSITNPDGQLRTGNGILEVTAPTPVYFLSVSPDTIISKDPSKGKFWKPAKRGKGQKPNWANLLDETVAQGGFQPGASESDVAGGMVVGVSSMENVGGKWKPVKTVAATRGWVRLTKWNPAKNLGKGFNVLQKTLDDKGAKHSGTPRGFNQFANGKPFVKQQSKLPPKKQNNSLFAEMVALKLNIAASQLGKTPAGFGDLIFDQDTSPFDDLTVLQLANRADSMLTIWQSIPQVQYDSLYSAVRRINRAFLGSFDTLTFEQGFPPKLTLAGAVDVGTVPFLKLPSPFVPTVMLPTTDETESEEDFDDFEEEDEMEGGPTVARLYQNFPNPFNPSTTIAFRLAQDAVVTLIVYNVLGQEIGALLVSEEFDEGMHTVEFSGLDLPSGVYFYRINATGLDDAHYTVASRKMLLVK